MSSGYVPCAGTVPQQLGITVSTGGSVEPTHSVPDTSYPPGVEQETLVEEGGSVEPTHSDPGVYYPPGDETQTVRQDGGSTEPSHSGPWQNDSDASELPPQQPSIVATEGMAAEVGSQDGIIYTHPIGKQSYEPPESD